MRCLFESGKPSARLHEYDGEGLKAHSFGSGRFKLHVQAVCEAFQQNCLSAHRHIRHDLRSVLIDTRSKRCWLGANACNAHVTVKHLTLGRTWKMKSEPRSVLSSLLRRKGQRTGVAGRGTYITQTNQPYLLASSFRVYENCRVPSAAEMKTLSSTATNLSVTPPTIHEYEYDSKADRLPYT